MIKTVNVKAYGKINIGLNINGKADGYHALDSVLASVSLFDVITLRTRKCKDISLSVKGASAEEISEADNNAYKAVRAFMDRFGTGGAEIKLRKNIPVASGLGGSAADIVGTVRAMAQAYGVNDDLTPLVNSLCSDGEFLLNGGFARITGRGNISQRFVSKFPLYVVIAVPDCLSVTKSVFDKFDDGNYEASNADIENIIYSLSNGEKIGQRQIFNALAAPAMDLNEDIRKVYQALLDLSPDIISMSGSGSAVYASFESPELCLWAKDKLKRVCDTVFVCETLNAY